MERHLAVLVLLCLGDFGAVKTARATDLDAFCTLFHCVLYGALHRMAERHTLDKLLSDGLCHQLCIGFSLVDFLDIDDYFRRASDGSHESLDLVDALGSLLVATAFAFFLFLRFRDWRSRLGVSTAELATDYDARTSRENRNTDTFSAALDDYLADCR